jgi:hypothetical protein
VTRVAFQKINIFLSRICRKYQRLADALEGVQSEDLHQVRPRLHCAIDALLLVTEPSRTSLMKVVVVVMMMMMMMMMSKTEAKKVTGLNWKNYSAPRFPGWKKDRW